MRNCTCPRDGSYLCGWCQALAARAIIGPAHHRALVCEPADALESTFQARVRRAALELGWQHYHTFDSRRSDPDFPDSILLRAGQLIVWELKIGRKKPTQGQLNWLSLFRTVPGVVEAGVRYPSDWPQMITLLCSRYEENHDARYRDARNTNRTSTSRISREDS